MTATSSLLLWDSTRPCVTSGLLLHQAPLPSKVQREDQLLYGYSFSTRCINYLCLIQELWSKVSQRHISDCHSTASKLTHSAASASDWTVKELFPSTSTAISLWYTGQTTEVTAWAAHNSLYFLTPFPLPPHFFTLLLGPGFLRHLLAHFVSSPQNSDSHFSLLLD